MSGIPRRAILARGGLVAGAASSGGFAWRLSQPGPSQPGVPAPLHVAGLRVLGPRQRLVVGSSRTLRGVLHDVPGGPAVGAFFATSVVLAEPDLLAPETGFLETHLLTLPDGTLTAVGTVHHDGTGAFTVTGGSGRFLEVRGSYRSLQWADHSASGTADLTFTDLGRPWPSTPS